MRMCVTLKLCTEANVMDIYNIFVSVLYILLKKYLHKAMSYDLRKLEIWHTDHKDYCYSCELM